MEPDPMQILDVDPRPRDKTLQPHLDVTVKYSDRAPFAAVA
jgi:hypothetical protein